MHKQRTQSFLEEHGNEIAKAMKQQCSGTTEDHLVDMSFQIGLKLIQELEEDTFNVRMSLYKTLGLEEEYKQILAEDIAGMGQGKQERLVEEHTVSDLETTWETITGQEVKPIQ